MAPRRIQVHRAGPPRVLRPEPFEPEPPGVGEVQVEVTYVGVNFADLLQRIGLYGAAPRRPFVPGFEVAGRVAELGPDVAGIEVGDKVAAVTEFGGYQSHVNARADAVFPVGSLSMEEAAAFPTVYLTAWEALHNVGRVRAGERVLVHGGAGGVGLAAISIAKHLGCEVYATCGSPDKVRFLQEEAGVEQAFDYRAAPWRPQLEQAVGRVDCVLESQGGKNLRESQQVLQPRGRVVIYGAQEVAPGTRRNVLTALNVVRQMRVPTLPMVRHSTGVLAFHLLWMWRDGVDLRSEAERLIALMEDEKITRPRVDRVFSFDDVADAHQYIHDRKNIGKVLLQP